MEHEDDKITSCPACGIHQYKKIIMSRDWEFNTGNIYQYFLCSNCGSLYRENSGINSKKLYDSSTYGSLNYSLENKYKHRNFLKQKLLNVRDEYWYLNKHRLIGGLLCKIIPAGFPFRGILTKDMKFLDVGAGVGETAYALRNLGFNANAIEPYLPQDMVYKNGLKVEKKFVSDIKSENYYDIVFMNNVVEHLEEPIQTLKDCYKILKMGGYCLISIPGMGKMTEKYLGNSYIIQAPQHVCLYSEKGIEEIAAAAGFKVLNIKRNAVYQWYKKSYMLSNNIKFSEDSVNSVKLTRGQKREIMMEYKDSFADEGDWYLITLQK